MIKEIVDKYRVYSGHGYIIPTKKIDAMVSELESHVESCIKGAEANVLKRMMKVGEEGAVAAYEDEYMEAEPETEEVSERDHLDTQ
jgi:hypothetical protein